jgi:hypothetical protein
LKNENFQTRKAFENIYDYWQDIERPGFSDWQHCYPNDGWGKFPKFGGKIYREGRFDTLYI